MRTLRNINKQFDYQTYVETHFEVRYAENELRICCPACTDYKYKCYVNDSKKVFHCFLCDFSNKHFDVFDFVAFTEGITRGKAQQRLMAEYQPTTPDDLSELDEELDGGTRLPSRGFEIKAIDGMPEAAKPLTQENKRLYSKYWNYLLHRGLTDDEIEAIGMHCVARGSYRVIDSKGREKGNIGRRVLWPVYGGDNQLVSWQARAVRSFDVPKYLNCPEAEQAKTVWPYVKPVGTHAVIVEGMFDAVAARRVPKVNAYASFSKKLSKYQYQLLKSWGIDEITLFWDKSDAKRDMLREIEELKLQFSKVYVPDWKDWPADVDLGDCLRNEEGVDNIKKALDNRIDVISGEFVLWQLT